MENQTPKTSQRTLADYTNRFWVLGFVTFLIFGYFIAYFVAARENIIVKPVPEWRWTFIIEAIIFLVIVCACGLGLKDTGRLFGISFSWLSLSRRDNLLVFATIAFLGLLAFPCFALGGPFISGFGHTLITMGAITIIVTASNYVRGGILSFCLAAFITSLLWPLEHVTVENKSLHDLFQTILILISLLFTVGLSWGTSKGSIFDNITADQASDPVTTPALPPTTAEPAQAFVDATPKTEPEEIKA